MNNTPIRQDLRILPLTPETHRQFLDFHARTQEGAPPGSEGGWCFCVAWWVPHWVGFNDRSREENRALREQLLAIGIGDGWLAVQGEQVVGWCQGGPRDRLGRIAFHYKRPPDPDCWAIGCLHVAHPQRRQGVARALLAGAIEQMRRAGARRVEAYPRLREAPDPADPGDLWPGPLALYRSLGFRMIGRKGPVRILNLDLEAGQPAPRP